VGGLSIGASKSGGKKKGIGRLRAQAVTRFGRLSALSPKVLLWPYHDRKISSEESDVSLAAPLVLGEAGSAPIRFRAVSALCA
jgi:hypothetical protein